jgi:hypothetical protein
MHAMNAFGRVAVYFQVFFFCPQPLYLQCKSPLLPFEEKAGLVLEPVSMLWKRRYLFPSHIYVK